MMPLFFLMFDTLVNYTPKTTEMMMENQPFEDVSPVKDGDFPLPCYFPGGYWVCLFFEDFQVKLCEILARNFEQFRESTRFNG